MNLALGLDFLQLNFLSGELGCIPRFTASFRVAFGTDGGILADDNTLQFRSHGNYLCR
jgi:hypothetical protein